MGKTTTHKGIRSAASAGYKAGQTFRANGSSKRPGRSGNKGEARWTVYDQHGELLFSLTEPFQGGAIVTCDAPGEGHVSAGGVFSPRASRGKRDRQIIRIARHLAHEMGHPLRGLQIGVIGSDGRVYDESGELLGHGA